MKKLLITIPCYNEELVIEKNAALVYAYAAEHLSQFDWRLFILDNNSRDGTWAIAQKIQLKDPARIVIGQVSIPGRGAALRIAWSDRPEYDLYAYVDADLSTDMKDFAFVINKVAEGHDLVTGSRYLPNSETKRDFMRKVLSKTYNLLLKLVLRVNFRDAQCGFKAMSNRVIRDLFPLTVDNGWFWDTELMIYASRMNHKVLEVPVSWREARDELRKSTVAVYTEVFRNLRNIYVMHQRLRRNPVASSPRSSQRG
jgi:glycosyltransferase involved in cell wall biosynthesis